MGVATKHQQLIISMFANRKTSSNKHLMVALVMLSEWSDWLGTKLQSKRRQEQSSPISMQLRRRMNTIRP